MDLDQESLPHGGPALVVLDGARRDPALPVSKPRKLEEFGGVGELTVQLRTARAADASFEELLSTHKEKHEKEERDHTPPVGYVCRRCRMPGHWLQQCPNQPVDKKATPPPTYVCHRCNKPGHWISACPLRAGDKGAEGSSSSGAAAPNHKNKNDRGAEDEEDDDNDDAIGLDELFGDDDDDVDDGDENGGHDGDTNKGEFGAVEGQPANGSGASKRARASGPKSSPAAPAHGVPGSGYVCKACHGTGHWLQQCPRYEEYKAGAPPPGYVCHKCNQSGHWLHNCTYAPKWKSHSAADGRPAVDDALVVDAEAREVGDEIAEALEEAEQEVVYLVQRCVAVLGEASAREQLVQTWQIEDSGGLLTTDGTNRRRTAGGVFFWLVKQRASAADRVRIFRNSGKS